VSSALNVLWLFAWQYEALLASVVIMLLLLGSLIAIYVRLGVGKEKVTTTERLAVHLPFSVYLGWITVATVANISAMLVSIEWDGFGIAPEIWAIVVLSLVVIITAVNAFDRRDAGRHRHKSERQSHHRHGVHHRRGGGRGGLRAEPSPLEGKFALGDVGLIHGSILGAAWRAPGASDPWTIGPRRGAHLTRLLIDSGRIV
jgi:hypothetical protein